MEPRRITFTSTEVAEMIADLEQVDAATTNLDAKFLLDGVLRLLVARAWGDLPNGE